MPIHTRKMDWTSTILNVQYNIYKSHNGTMNKVLIEHVIQWLYAWYWYIYKYRQGLLTLRRYSVAGKHLGVTRLEGKCRLFLWNTRTSSDHAIHAVFHSCAYSLLTRPSHAAWTIKVCFHCDCQPCTVVFRSSRNGNIVTLIIISLVSVTQVKVYGGTYITCAALLNK